MKRTELEVGETYAYTTGKYDVVSKVRIVSAEATYRVNSGGRGWHSTAHKDGITVALIDGALGWGHNVPAAFAADALVNPDKYESRTILSLYDEDTEDGYEVSRVLPRYIISTWADHKRAELDAEEARMDRTSERLERQRNERELFNALPARYREFIELKIYNDGSGGWRVDEWRIQDLVRLLIEEDAL